MSLDPQVSALLQQMADSNMPNPMDLGVDGYRRMLARMPPMEEGEPVKSVRDIQVAGGAGHIPARAYYPNQTNSTPGVLVFFHGGGFVACGLDSHDGLCRALCNASGHAVIAVDYRLSPEAQHPKPLEDCFAATCWVAENADKLGVDGTRLAVGGDSAGGNLAAAVCLLARDRTDKPAIVHQFLLDPVLDSACNTPSYEEFAQGYFLTKDLMHWFWGHYLGSEADPGNAYASPSHAECLSNLPPATVISAECDPLRDEAERYAHRLKADGVTATCKRYDGMIHGFLSFAMVDTAQVARREIGQWMADALTA